MLILAPPNSKGSLQVSGRSNLSISMQCYADNAVCSSPWTYPLFKASACLTGNVPVPLALPYAKPMMSEAGSIRHPVEHHAGTWYTRAGILGRLARPPRSAHTALLRPGIPAPKRLLPGHDQEDRWLGSERTRVIIILALARSSVVGQQYCKSAEIGSIWGGGVEAACSGRQVSKAAHLAS
jgi:hypothetical protein